MKISSSAVVVFVVLLCCTSVFAQTDSPFFEQQIIHARGNSVLIGNTILGDDPKTAFNNLETNNDQTDFCYVDIDDTDTTFSSSAASFVLPETSSKILYAGLYWGGLCPAKNEIRNKEIGKLTSGFIKGSRKERVQEVQLKINGGDYEKITGQIIFDYKEIDPFAAASPYACFANVTAQLTALKEKVSITIANINASSDNIEDSRAAGWLLFVVYEDDSQSFKHFKSYSGFKDISKEALVVLFENLPPSNENTLSSKILMATLEGDNSNEKNSFALFNGSQGQFIPLTSQRRPAQNLFNHDVSDMQNIKTLRNPASKNTLGFKLLKINVLDNSINTSSTEAIIRLSTNSDVYYPFFVAFEIETDKAILQEQDAAGSTAITTAQNLNPTVLLQPSSRDRRQAKIIRNPLGSMHVRQDLFPSPGFGQKNQVSYPGGKTPTPTLKDTVVTKTEIVEVTVPEIKTTSKPAVVIVEKKAPEPITAKVKTEDISVTPVVAKVTAPAPISKPEILKAEPINTVTEIKTAPKPAIALVKNKSPDPIAEKVKKDIKKATPVVSTVNSTAPVSKPEVLKPEPVNSVVNSKKTLKSTISEVNNEIEKSEKTESVSATDVAPGYYLVTKVFDNETSAVMWKRKLDREGYSVGSFINNETKQFYIYIENSSTPEKMQTRKQALKRNPIMAETRVCKVNL